MKIFVIGISFVIILLSPLTASAELGNQGLIINGGVKEIHIEAGEKKKLWVRDGLTGLPLTKGVHFYSDNDLIATIGEDSGILHGISAGSAHITIMSSSGRSARIRVISESNRKASPLLFIFIIAPLAIIFSIQKLNSKEKVRIPKDTNFLKCYLSR